MADRGAFRVMERTRHYVGKIMSETPLDERYLERIDPGMGELHGIHLIKGQNGRTQIYGLSDGMGFSRDDLLTLALELIDLAGPEPVHDPKHND